MSGKSPLEGRTILVVDDEPDVLESVGEILDVAIVHKAADYDTALQYLLGYTYDFVILDIMGVNGFELLRESVDRGFPTVMLTAHALTPAALKQSIKLGAVSFLPKEQMGELKSYLEEELEGKKQIWQRIYDKLVSHFNSRFGPGWREKDVFFKEFEKELRRG
ncbi:MAG: response regulator [Deltaproteobacteria bacterium HGW-Deltaproteobacteria-15]|jgi:DNA-binding NtrC family response regulator|nr:MAG: response regulator [Deltaproteobacteria bacterium HGW-Deltaproteobacteria-15]